MAGLLDYLEAIGETGAMLGTGAVSGAVGMPYGVYKGIRSGKYGTPEGVRIAEEEARRFMERNTYQPRSQMAQNALSYAGGLLSDARIPPIIPEAAALSAIPLRPAARMAGEGVAATGRFVAPKAGQLAEQYMQGMGMMPGIVQKAPSMGSVDVAAYQGSHKAPNAAVYGGTLDDLSKIMPADVYSSQGIRLYGLNDPKVDAEWFKAAYQAKNNPEKLVNVYRAVPKGIKGINSGDWVTTSPTYAKMHGENALGGDYEILSSKVPAKTLSSEGYPYEFGYNAPNQEELKRLQAGGLLAP